MLTTSIQGLGCNCVWPPQHASTPGLRIRHDAARPDYAYYCLLRTFIIKITDTLHYSARKRSLLVGRYRVTPESRPICFQVPIGWEEQRARQMADPSDGVADDWETAQVQISKLSVSQDKSAEERNGDGPAAAAASGEGKAV